MCNVPIYCQYIIIVRCGVKVIYINYYNHYNVMPKCSVLVGNNNIINIKSRLIDKGIYRNFINVNRRIIEIFDHNIIITLCSTENFNVLFTSRNYHRWSVVKKLEVHNIDKGKNIVCVFYPR